jgi:hypothetical protein
VAPLTDPRLLASFLEALKEWNCDGFIQWKRLPAEWLRKNLENLSQKAVGQLMWEYVASGGEIDQVAETREGYHDLYECHYDFRVPVAGRLIYIETLFEETKMGPTIYVVNIHDA